MYLCSLSVWVCVCVHWQNMTATVLFSHFVLVLFVCTFWCFPADHGGCHCFGPCLSNATPQLRGCLDWLPEWCYITVMRPPSLVTWAKLHRHKASYTNTTLPPWLSPALCPYTLFCRVFPPASWEHVSVVGCCVYCWLRICYCSKISYGLRTFFLFYGLQHILIIIYSFNISSNTCNMSSFYTLHV